jgi:GDP-L-fucose synthase
MCLKVLVTGGSGFVGSNLKKIRPNWIYISSNDYDLKNPQEVQFMYKDIKPDVVLHLAAKVGGIKENAEKQADFYYINTAINTNIIKYAVDSGVQKLVAALSTCVFPDILENYPFTESDIFKGPPSKTNFSYGYSKRGLYTHCMAVRQQYGLNYSCFSPSNIYGPGDYFDNPESSHFVAALISKIAAARDGDCLEFWGTGNPLRQQLYVKDLCDIITVFVEQYFNTDKPVIVAPNENLSIKEMIDIAIRVSGKEISYKFNGKLDGQYRKDGSNEYLTKIIDYKFTSFEDGIRNTYNSYNKERKV